MIRLKDIAARAGVSLMTVSKVLRDAPDVSALTKARIRRLSEEMGYVPDALARGLRTRTTKLFGLVIGSIADPLLGSICAAVQDQAHQWGYDLLVAQTQDEPQREETSIRRMMSRRVDGLFIAPVYRLAPNSAVYEELHTAGIPTVLLGHRASFCRAFPSVETDDALASCQLTEHLIRLGHRQIAFFAGPPAAPWAQERLEGYRRALREAQIPFDDRLIFTAGAMFADGERAAGQMLGESTDPTAVQTASDLVAMGAANFFLARGLRIPNDLSLTGFGNSVMSEHFRLGLTTVQLPNYALGLAAAESMQRSMRGEAVAPLRLTGKVLIRESTGAPVPRQATVHESLPSLSSPWTQGDDLQ
jgi:LacI family transcriptional regulator